MNGAILEDKRPKVEKGKNGFLGTNPLYNSRRSALMGINLSNALESLWANRLRSALTLLGIVIGVAGFVAVVILTQGAGAQFNTFADSITAKTLTVIPGTASQGAGGQTTIQGGGSQSIKLTPADVQAVRGLAHVVEASPSVGNAGGGQISFGGYNWSTTSNGISGTHQINYWATSEGSWWSDSDEQAGLSVVVLGQTVVANTFALSGTDPIGKDVRIGHQLYRVVGVLSARGLSPTAGGLDDVAFVPYTNLLHLNVQASISQVMVEADNVTAVDQVKQEVTAMLQQRHPLSSSASNGFLVQTSDQQIKSQQQTGSIIAVILLSIGSILLIVGGIGIMNIMLVSVTERTREIGLRSALGAEPGDIRNQFLMEALAISIVGGIIGLPLGILGGYLLTLEAHYPFSLSPISFFIAIGVAALIGTVFGFYPAVRAARLDPVVALRSE